MVTDAVVPMIWHFVGVTWSNWSTNRVTATTRDLKIKLKTIVNAVNGAHMRLILDIVRENNEAHLKTSSVLAQMMFSTEMCFQTCIVAEVFVLHLADVALKVVAFQMLVQLLVPVKSFPTELTHRVEILSCVGVFLTRGTSSTTSNVVSFQCALGKHLLFLNKERLVTQAELAELHPVILA